MMQREQKKQRTKKVANPLPLRMNILFFVVFILFSILVLRLGEMQIVNGEFYTSLVKQTDKTQVNYPVPRGKIYDSNYNLVVYNVPQKAITYTPPKNPQPHELLDLAKKLDRFITMDQSDIEKVKDREKKDIWILENNNGNDLITEEEMEMYRNKQITDKELYQLKLDRVTDDKLAEVDDNIAAIYRKLYSSIAFTPTVIKSENITDEEYALVSEHLVELPGIDVTTDWKRERNFGDTFWNILGSITSSEKGLPEEKADEYLAKGYSLNERIGDSYIEELYDDVLIGNKQVVETVTDKSGNILLQEVLYEGQAGKDIVLTIDMEFQEKVEQILEEELLNAIRSPNTLTLDTGFVVAIEPKTGYILAMSGKYYDRKDGRFYDYTPGTFTASYEPGSAVKGATLLAGYQSGARQIGEYDHDAPMKLAGSATMSSWTTMGYINDLTALERSSNVYMWKTAIKVMGGRYGWNQSPGLKEGDIDKIRYYFEQLGLGASTGIGFKNETLGIKSNDLSTYHQIAIGQLDTYTPLQLAQYAATIANNGYRMKAQLVKEIREPNPESDELGPIFDVNEPEVLNKAEFSDAMLRQVQNGFWRVTHGSQGTARGYFANEPYDTAGKTGTAESSVTIDGRSYDTYHLSFIGYAPFDDPEIAIAVMVPNATIAGRQSHSAANVISQRVFRAFFGLE